MEDYKKPFTLKDKLKKSVGMKVRQKYEQIPLLSEEEIREKYKEEDWGFLVNYVKQHSNELIKEYRDKTMHIPMNQLKKQIEEANKNPKVKLDKYCPYHKVKLIKLTVAMHGSGWVKEYNRICPICGYVGEISHEMNRATK